MFASQFKDFVLFYKAIQSRDSAVELPLGALSAAVEEVNIWCGRR